MPSPSQYLDLPSARDRLHLTYQAILLSRYACTCGCISRSSGYQTKFKSVWKEWSCKLLSVVSRSGIGFTPLNFMTWHFDIMLMKTGKMKNVDCSHCNILEFCSSFASKVISEHLICSNRGGHASHCTFFLWAFFCLFICFVAFFVFVLFACFVCLFFNFIMDTVHVKYSNTSICSLSTFVKTDIGCSVIILY